MSAERPVEQGHCFLSYARDDERFALRFANDMRARGIGVWVDQLNIRTSEHWDRAVEHAIRECRAMIVILSPRAVVSDNVADEISVALECGKTIIPLLIEQCRLPLRLTRMHLIDASSYESALGQCLAAVKAAAKTSASDSADADLADEILVVAEQRLAVVLGPIASILVEEAGRRAASQSDLYGILSLHIDDEDDRERFLTHAPRLSAATDMHPHVVGDRSAVAQSDVKRVAGVLTHYIGPIAFLVAKRESQAAASLKDLLRRVAATIGSEQDRADFYREVEMRAFQSSSSS